MFSENQGEVLNAAVDIVRQREHILYNALRKLEHVVPPEVMEPDAVQNTPQRYPQMVVKLDAENQKAGVDKQSQTEIEARDVIDEIYGRAA